MKDTEDYKLNEENYVPVACIKTQIVLAHTSNSDMKHVVGWQNRYNGENKRTAAFTIDVSGKIHQHFDPKYQSRYFGKLEQDTKSIIILLDNEGWLTKNDKNKFINWVGDIYNHQDEVFEKKWRGYEYWAPYTKEQYKSALELVRELCDEFYIPKIVFSHNTKVDYLDEYHGVLYKSNIDKNNTDLNPSWDFEKFKNNLEEK